MSFLASFYNYTAEAGPSTAPVSTGPDPALPGPGADFPRICVPTLDNPVGGPVFTLPELLFYLDHGIGDIQAAEANGYTALVVAYLHAAPVVLPIGTFMALRDAAQPAPTTTLHTGSEDGNEIQGADATATAAAAAGDVAGSAGTDEQNDAPKKDKGKAKAEHPFPEDSDEAVPLETTVMDLIREQMGEYDAKTEAEAAAASPGGEGGLEVEVEVEPLLFRIVMMVPPSLMPSAEGSQLSGGYSPEDPLCGEHSLDGVE